MRAWASEGFAAGTACLTSPSVKPFGGGGCGSFAPVAVNFGGGGLTADVPPVLSAAGLVAGGEDLTADVPPVLPESFAAALAGKARMGGCFSVAAGFEVFGVCSKTWKEIDKCKKKVEEKAMDFINTSDDALPV